MSSQLNLWWSFLLVSFLCPRMLVGSGSSNIASTSTATFYGALHSLQTLPSTSLHVCLQFSTASQGTLLSASATNDTFVLLTLTNTSIVASLQDQHQVTIPLSQSHTTKWLSIELSVSPTQLSLTLNGSTVQTSLTQALNFTGDLHIGGDSLANLPPYIGCIANLTVNSLTRQFSDDTFHSGCCIPPSSRPSEALGAVNSSLWDGLRVQARGPRVDRGSTVVITKSYFELLFPEGLVGDDTTSYWLRRDVERRIGFDVVQMPSKGYFSRGISSTQTGYFTYEDLGSTNEHSQVFYHHNGEGISADSALLRAHFVCEDGSEGPWSGEVRLPLTITEPNDPPYIVHQNPIRMAIGTRKVLTSEILKVKDKETTNASLLHYTLEFVAAMSVCELCQNESRGQIEKVHTPGQYIRFFSQIEIDSQQIAFQHFAGYGNEEVTIGFRVRDRGGKHAHPQIQVNLFPGQISFTPALGIYECMFLESGKSIELTQNYYDTTTNFADQDPTVSYHMLQPLEMGIIEIYRPETEAWHLVNVSSNQPGVSNFFTQADVNQGYVRYTHTGLVDLDRLFFRLVSSTYVQPEEHLACFHVIHEDDLEQPEFLIEINTVTLDEGDQVLIGPSTIDASLSQKDLLYSPAGVGVDIRIDQLHPIFLINSAPVVGHLLVNEQPLVQGDSFSLSELLGGMLYYSHNGSEAHNDSFTVTIQPTTDVDLIKKPEPSAPFTVDIEVAPVNDNTPVYVSGGPIEVTEGSYVRVTRDHILVTDQDLPRETLTIHFRKKANKATEVQTGVFALGSVMNIPSCTMADIESGRVSFYHTFNESAHLEYDQTMRITDGDATHLIKPKPQIRVVAIPYNLSVVMSRDDCLLELDLLDSYIALLNHTHFSFAMQDRFGNDPNLIDMVTVSILDHPEHGVLFKVWNNTSEPTSKFTVNDLKMSRIHYNFTSSMIHNTTFDSFTLSFNYGHSISGPVLVPVCVKPDPVIDHVLVRPTANISQEGLSQIDSSHLWANNTRGESGDFIYYRVVTRPLFGRILVNISGPREVANEFTQSQLDNGMVSYSRTLTTGRESDRMTLVVCTTGDACEGPLTLELLLSFVNITVVNPGVHVFEGGIFIFNESFLSGVAPPGSSEIRFEITSFPIHGMLQLTYGSEVRNQTEITTFDMEDIRGKRFSYIHDDSENFLDGITVRVKTLYREKILQVLELVKITVIPVNDHKPFHVNRNTINVAWEGTVQITPYHVSAGDDDMDQDTLDLVFDFLGFNELPLYGYFYLESEPDVPVTRWTQRDIVNGRLFYRPIIDSSDDTFVYYVIDDGGKRTDEVFGRIDILDIVFVSVHERFDFTVSEGESRVITSEFLQYKADNDDSLTNSQIVFTIKELTKNGMLIVNGVVQHEESSFTQQAIADGQFVYHHDHSNTVSDSFKFTLSDSNGRDGGETFEFDVIVLTIDDDPPQVAILRTVLVQEKSTIIIDSDVIQITDNDTIIDDNDTPAADRINCHVVQQPRFGQLQKSVRGQNWTKALAFTKYDVDIRSFRYDGLTADNDDRNNDSFTFNVTDGKNENPMLHRVEIYLLPERLTLDKDELQVTVEEGGSEVLDEEHFVVEHFYLSKVPGTVYVHQPPVNGHLENSATGETGMSNFTTEDLESKIISYVHNGDENIEDHFTFRYTSHDPQNMNRASEVLVFEITVAPNNDQVPVLSPNRLQYLELWHGEVKPLDQQYFNATDKDTPSNFLTYYVSTGLSDGYLSYTDKPLKAITNFTQAQVNNGEISFVHHSDQSGEIRYNVSDGEFMASGVLQYDAEVLGLFCNLDSCPWKPVTVEQSGEVVLSKEHLCCKTNDEESNRRVVYHIDSIEHGEFLLGDNVTMEAFSRDQLELGQVSYRHTDLERWESVDTIDLAVRTDFNTELNMKLNITIQLPDVVGKPAINNGLVVIEGERACLSVQDLEARNVRYDAFLSTNKTSSLDQYVIHYSLTRLPTNGILAVGDEELIKLPAEFTHSDIMEGRVCYTHDNSESASDFFDFTLSITGPGVNRIYDVPDIVNITVNPVNDIRPSLVTSFPEVELVQGFNRVLSATDLKISDRDSPSENIRVYIQSLPDNANIFLDRTTMTVGSYFTQLDIMNGDVILQPTKSPSSGFFTFSFTDENSTSTTAHQFNITVVPHTLTVVGTHKITYKQRQEHVMISNLFLNASTNGDSSKTVYTITSPPEDGEVVIEPRPEPVGQARSVLMFTQADINRESVWYIPNHGSKGHRDGFIVNVMSRNLTVLNIGVSIHSLVNGDIKQNTVVSFTEGVSKFQLPTDLIVLGDNRDYTFTVLEKPLYGKIELIFSKRPRIKRESSVQFHYDELRRGWVYYTWDPLIPISEGEVKENFTLLVTPPNTNLRPGEAFIELTIQPPPSTQAPTTQEATGSSNSVPTEQPTDSLTGFPEVAVFLIVGMIVFLGVMLLVVIGFCVLQKKRIGSKIHRHLSPIPPQGTFRASPSISPSRHAGQHFNFDPNRIESEVDRHSLSSGFSEDGVLPPLRSPLRSPTHSQAFSYSQPYSGHPSPIYTSHRPLPRMPTSRRVPSQISITFSGRQSALSQASNEGFSRNYSSSLPRHPAELAVPIPLRPASQQAYNAVRGESGYNSYSHTTQNSHLASASSVAPEESSLGDFPSALDYDDHMIDHVTDLEDHVTKLKPANGRHPDTVLADDQEFNTLLSNIQKQFRQPVVKKQDYWF